MNKIHPHFEHVQSLWRGDCEAGEMGDVEYAINVWCACVLEQPGDVNKTKLHPKGSESKVT